MKNMKNFGSFNKKIFESFEQSSVDFIEECFIYLSDLGFELTYNRFDVIKSSNESFSAEFNGEYSLEEIIDLYTSFIIRLQFKFDIKGHSIEFLEKKIEIEVKLIEKNLDELTDSIKISLNNKDEFFKIVDINRNKINVNKKVYLVGLRFFINNTKMNGFIDFEINWRRDGVKLKSNIKKFKTAFISPDFKIRLNTTVKGNVQIDKENAEKLYNYFSEKGGGWRYGNNDDYSVSDFTKQFTYKDLMGNWNIS